MKTHRKAKLSFAKQTISNFEVKNITGGFVRATGEVCSDHPCPGTKKYSICEVCTNNK